MSEYRRAYDVFRDCRSRLGVQSIRERRLRLRIGLNARRFCMRILWTIIIGFVAGVIAKLLHPGPNELSGFVLTAILGIVWAFVATYLVQAIGWDNAGAGAGRVGAVVAPVVVLEGVG